MKLGIMQPYFMPYIGYWQLMKAVDTYVVYDDVQYIKGGWISRNNMLLNGKKKMFTIILHGASSNKLINEIEVGDDFKKFERTLALSYGKAPYYKDTMDVLNAIFSYSDRHLGHFLYNSFQQIMCYLDIKTNLLLSSTIEKDNTLHGKDKVIHICRQFGATEYYNSIGGQMLYDKLEFKANGIDLHFLQTDIMPYKQFKNEFVSGLSMIDVMMFNSQEEINVMLDKYTLV